MNKSKSTTNFINYPLGIISLFFSISEAFVLYSITKASGSIQWVLIIFAFIILFGVGFMFFYILWKKPYLYYPPSEYNQDVKPGDYISAIKDSNRLGHDSFKHLTIDKSEIITIPEKNNTVEDNAIKKERSKIDEAFDLISEKKYSEARNLFLEQAKTEKDPLFSKSFIGAAAFTLSLYDFNAAINEFDKLINKSKEPFFVFYFWYSKIFTEIKDFDSAISIINNGINSSNNRIKNDLILEKIRILIEKKDIATAEELINDYVKKALTSKQKAESYRILSTIYYSQNQSDQAKKDLLIAYKTNPTDFENVSAISSILNEQKDYKLELYFRLQALEMQETVNTLGLLSNCFLRNNFHNLAMKEYMKANEIAKGQEEWILANIGNEYNNVGLYDLAMKFLNEALTLKPEDQYAQNVLASVLTNIKKENEELKKITEEINL